MSKKVENKHHLNRRDLFKVGGVALGTLFAANLALLNYILNQNTSSPLPTLAEVKPEGIVTTEEDYRQKIKQYLEKPVFTPEELITRETIDYLKNKEKIKWLGLFPERDIAQRRGEETMQGNNRIPSIKAHITETVRNEMILANNPDPEKVIYLNPLFGLTWNIIGPHADLEVASFKEVFSGDDNRQQLIATTIFWNQNSETDYTQKPTILFNANAFLTFTEVPKINNLGIIKELVAQSSAALVPIWLRNGYNNQFHDPNPPQQFWDTYETLPYKDAYVAWNLGALGSVFNHPEIISTNKYTIDILSQARINPSNLAAVYDDYASVYAAKDIENRKVEDAWMNPYWISYIQDFDPYFYKRGNS